MFLPFRVAVLAQPLVVVHTTGDGCFRMNCHELATVEHYHLPIITVVFNNGTLGMVRQWQNLIYLKTPRPKPMVPTPPEVSSCPG